MPDTIAQPTTTPAPASVPVATPPAPTTGFFDHLAIPEPSTSEIRTDTPPEEKPEAVPAATPEKIYAGRFKNADELEIAYRESSSEGLRLYQESRLLSQQISELKSKLSEAEERSKLGMVMPFKELSKEQFEKLSSEDPVKAAEYIFDKKMHDRDFAAAQEQTKSQRESSERSRAKTEQFILERGKQLSSDPEKYPDYMALIPDMEAMSKRIPDFQGKAWAPDFLYLAALGRKELQSRIAGKKATQEAANKTKSGASAVATATSSPGASPTEVKGSEDPNSDASVMKAIIAAGNRQLFKV